MKKLALIGSSSAHIDNGYGLLLKKQYGEQCDIFAVGGSTIIWPLFALLCVKIIGVYEYVVICYGTNDTSEIDQFGSNYSIHISYLAYIAKLFQNSPSTPIILFSAYLNYPKVDKYNSYARAVCSLFNIPFIDLHKYFEYIDPSTCTCDTAHYRLDLMEFIADKIKEMMLIKYHKLNDIQIEINFNVLRPASLNKEIIPDKMRGDAIDQTFYTLTLKDVYNIPEDKYICGIYYRIGNRVPYLIYKNTYITLSKNLDFLGLNNVDYCYSIGSSIFNGMKGGYISVSLNNDYTIQDPSLYAFKTVVNDSSPLYIHSILVSDLPPVKYGYQLFNYYHHVFQAAENDIYKILLRKLEYKIPVFWKRLEYLIPGSTEIFKQVLNYNPSITTIFNDDDDYRAEKLILWSWETGVYKNKSLYTYKSEIAKGVKKMLEFKYSTQAGDMPFILYIIWKSRNNLAYLDPETEEGLRGLKNWFIASGKDEYHLNEVELNI